MPLDVFPHVVDWLPVSFVAIYSYLYTSFKLSLSVPVTALTKDTWKDFITPGHCNVTVSFGSSGCVLDAKLSQSKIAQVAE